MSPRAAPLALALALLPATAAAQTADAWRAQPLREPPARAPRPHDPTRGLLVRLEVGPSLRSLYGVSLYGADFALDFGWRTARWFAGGGPVFQVGATASGLDTFLYGVRGSFGAILGPALLGGGLMVAGLQIDRSTRPGQTMEVMLMGPRAFVGVDLARWDHRALSLTLDAALMAGPARPIVAGTLFLGARL